jgi:hypothetical protein
MFTNALEKGHTMRKIIALAGATSALAIIAAANAASTGDSFQVTITGTVPGYCTIASTGNFTVSNGSFSSSGKSGNLAIANLGTTGGVVEAVSATGSFQINANESCAVSLVSGSGGLANQSNTSAKNISYSAVVFDSYSPNQNLIAVPATANTPFSSFNSHFDPATLGNETVSFGFSITAGGSPVAAGNSQDILTVNLTPTI